MTDPVDVGLDHIKHLANNDEYDWFAARTIRWLISQLERYQTFHKNDLELIKEQAEIIREANAKLAEKNGK